MPAQMTSTSHRPLTLALVVVSLVLLLPGLFLPVLTIRGVLTKDGIAQAFALADQGRLMEAAALCEEQMREHGPSAQAFYLMGLICSADGRLYAADRCYRKALYLDENHVDAMMHLAVLLEEQGDKRGAKRLRARAQSAGSDE